jgi:hypothetical protein
VPSHIENTEPRPPSLLNNAARCLTHATGLCVFKRGRQFRKPSPGERENVENVFKLRHLNSEGRPGRGRDMTNQFTSQQIHDLPLGGAVPSTCFVSR